MNFNSDDSVSEYPVSEPVVLQNPNVSFINQEMEVATLGIAIQDEESRELVLNKLTVEHYTDRNRKIVFTAMQEMYEQSMVIDLITLAEYLSNKGLLAKIGELKYLGSLTHGASSPKNAGTYVKLVHDALTVRGLLHVGNKIRDLTYEGISTPEKIEKANELLARLSDNQSAGGPVRLTDWVGKMVEVFDERMDRDGSLLGLSTGLDDLDEILSGLIGGDLVIVAGRPSQGKTTLAENMYRRNVNNNQNSIFFSIEMGGDQLMERMFAAEAGVDITRVRAAEMDDLEWSKFTTFFKNLSDKDSFIDDTPSISIGEICARAKALHRKHKLSSIYIDYLQLITSSDKATEALRIADITRRLKGLAKELNVPVVVLSQLSREVEKRSDKRPIMSDLRESGAIEQDADVIIMLYRDEYYNPDSEAKGLAEILIRKHRNGPVGEVIAKFEGRYSRFKNFNTYENYEYGVSGGYANYPDSYYENDVEAA